MPNEEFVILDILQAQMHRATGFDTILQIINCWVIHYFYMYRATRLYNRYSSRLNVMDEDCFVMPSLYDFLTCHFLSYCVFIGRRIIIWFLVMIGKRNSILIDINKHHGKLKANSARNFQPLRQIGVGTVVPLHSLLGCWCVYTVHCTLYTVHCTLYTVHCTLYTVHCTTWTNLCSVRLESNHLAHWNRASTSINRLFRTVQTCAVAQLVHRGIDMYIYKQEFYPSPLLGLTFCSAKLELLFNHL